MPRKNASPIATLHPHIGIIYWVAGIFEGEGTCFHSLRGGSQASVTQKDRWLCDTLQMFFGGSVGITKEIKGREYFYWTISGPRARGLIMTIYGLLSPHKQERIRLCLELWKNSTTVAGNALLRALAGKE
jgi:hypothetical protein